MGTRWLRSELRRLWLAVLVGAASGLPTAFGLLQVAQVPDEQVSLTAFLVFWVAFTLVYAALSFLAYRALPAAQLREALISGASEHGLLGRVLRVPGGRSLLGVSDAPSFGRQLAVVALVGVGAILAVPELRAEPFFRLLAAVVVVASWVNLLVTYAVHYARLDATAEVGFDFPGRDPRTLWDYLYFAMAVQTTFGTTDVTVPTTQLRRAVTGHGVLAFVFNAVILVLSLSLLLASG